MAELITESVCREANEATEALERLSAAANKALAAIEALDNAANGRVTINIVGDLCNVVIEPT